MKNEDTIEGIIFFIIGIITLVFGFILMLRPNGVYMSYFIIPGFFFIISLLRIFRKGNNRKFQF